MCSLLRGYNCFRFLSCDRARNHLCEHLSHEHQISSCFFIRLYWDAYRGISSFSGTTSWLYLPYPPSYINDLLFNREESHLYHASYCQNKVQEFENSECLWEKLKTKQTQESCGLFVQNTDSALGFGFVFLPGVAGSSVLTSDDSLLLVIAGWCYLMQCLVSVETHVIPMCGSSLWLFTAWTHENFDFS